MKTRNYKLLIQFDGTAYHGWQRQSGFPTVQEKIEQAIARTVAQPVNLHGCGRTDAGVHALGYVASFKVVSDLLPERMQGAVNSRLPDDIVVIDCDLVDDDFDARRSAVAKTYRYTTVVGPVRPVMNRHFVNHCRRTLDVEPMQQAAKFLVGEHDFASFCTQSRTQPNTVRTVYSIDVKQDGRTITMDFTGNGFLYNMVRTMAGCLLAVGLGEHQPEWVREVLEATDRSTAAATARAKGLTLVEVIYEGSGLRG